MHVSAHAVSRDAEAIGRECLDCGALEQQSCAFMTGAMQVPPHASILPNVAQDHGLQRMVLFNTTLPPLDHNFTIGKPMTGVAILKVLLPAVFGLDVLN